MPQAFQHRTLNFCSIEFGLVVGWQAFERLSAPSFASPRLGSRIAHLELGEAQPRSGQSMSARLAARFCRAWDRVCGCSLAPVRRQRERRPPAICRQAGYVCYARDTTKAWHYRLVEKTSKCCTCYEAKSHRSPTLQPFFLVLHPSMPPPPKTLPLLALPPLPPRRMRTCRTPCANTSALPADSRRRVTRAGCSPPWDQAKARTRRCLPERGTGSRPAGGRGEHG